MAEVDIVLSLHRSEGFGLVPAEAMQLGKPVVATGWSGNMDFMNERNSAPVSFRLVPVEDPYDGAFISDGQLWADADVGNAAEWLRRLAADPTLAPASRRSRPRRYRPAAFAGDHCAADCNSSRSRKGGRDVQRDAASLAALARQAPFAPMSQKRLISYRYMTLRASTAAGTLGTGLLQTFVFARALTPERFSLFIFLGALGYMLSMADAGMVKVLFVDLRQRFSGQTAASPDCRPSDRNVGLVLRALRRWPR